MSGDEDKQGSAPEEKPPIELRPPPGLTRREVNVKAETLQSIASEYGLFWEDLARINFATTEKKYINWYLRRRLGCKKQKDGWYVFSTKGKPGHLLVPQMPQRPAPKQGTTAINVPRDLAA